MDAEIQRVYVQDRPGMKIAFDVAMELTLEIKERDYHYDESDECTPWIRISCEGDLACSLDDWSVVSVMPYNPSNRQPNSLSDALVPIITFDQLETVANQFLKDYYPEALQITPHGQELVWVNPAILADRMELTIRTQRIKQNASAVRDANINAELNNIRNAEFFCGDSGEIMQKIENSGVKIDVVFMDPARAGADRRFLNALRSVSPEKIVYISCNPETLARDLSYLSKDYRITKIQPVDMFPMTKHIETVVLLIKK